MNELLELPQFINNQILFFHVGTENFYTLDTTQHNLKLNLIIRQSATEKSWLWCALEQSFFLCAAREMERFSICVSMESVSGEKVSPVNVSIFPFWGQISESFCVHKTRSIGSSRKIFFLLKKWMEGELGSDTEKFIDIWRSKKREKKSEHGIRKQNLK